MDAIQEDPITFSKKKLICARTVLPPGLKVSATELGKGSNNRVVACTWGDARCVLRMPRRRSDTQQKGSATWECRHTLRASQLGVAPFVYAAWYARHATRDHPSGLYMITDHFDDDLEGTLMSDSQRGVVLARSDEIGEAVARILARLADADMFLYDLKPSNMVVKRLTGSSELTVRMIDFGREFTEWAGTKEEDASTPVIDMVAMMAKGDVQLKRHILFATMLTQLAATTTHCLHTDRRSHRMDEATRRQINGIARVAGRLLDSLQGRHITMLRAVLRRDEVRVVLSHYHGRRNSGTRRTLQLARGQEI
mgnify:CR=1 FL=1|tara:strand:- start:3976 stop:4905 length:930 start_codon:yes stop_codon:yes gene_type:complete